MDEIATLQDLGLTEKESRVYLALLETGPASAYAVALKAQLKKPTVYVILDQLIEKALVYRVARKRKQLFHARHPKELMDIERLRMKRLDDLLPHLLAKVADATGDQVRTLSFEGITGMREAYFYRIEVLHGTELQAFYGTARYTDKSTKQLVLDWNTYNSTHDINIKAIVPDDPSLEQYRALDKQHNTQVRYLPYDQYSSETSMELTSGFVRIHMFDALQSLIIESPKVALVWKQLFSIVWASAAQKPPKTQ